MGQQTEATQIEEIAVLGERLHYSLENTPAPVLNYEKGFFQSFEPQSVGDMLKRVAGVAFSADIGEFESPQLRGLGPEYTKVLVNGQTIPGSSDDRTALVDRIPAELIERIQILRSPTADMDSQGIGGIINLVLKDGIDPGGTEWRLGSLYYGDLDPTAKPVGAITHAGRNGPWNFLLSANVQERLGPKSKSEQAYDDEGALVRLFNADDIRDSRDSSLIGKVAYDYGESGILNVHIARLQSQVEENEVSQTLNENLELDNSATERRASDQDRTNFSLGYSRYLNDSVRLELLASGGQFDETAKELEALIEDGQEIVQLMQLTNTDDREWLGSASLSWAFDSAHQVEIGMNVSVEDRDSTQLLLELDEDELVDVSPGSGLYRVEETRVGTYIKDIWQFSSSASLELGIRGEHTKLEQRGTDGRADDTQFELNPSAHLVYQVGNAGQLRLSFARALRRPGFNEIIPFTNRDTPDEDQVTVGNPSLQPEIATAIDLGYTRRFENGSGFLGINLYYRDIEDRIELTTIGEDLFTPDNIGHGKTWGLELDFAFPVPGIPQLGVFANYAFIDSEIRDPFTDEKRRFNLQPDYIGNIDLTHDLPGLGLRHGISLQKQGRIKDIRLDETKSVAYGANLEYFIEKSFGSGMIVRASVNNILDAKKKERGRLYEGLADLQAGQVDEFVFEREQSEPVFLLMVRGSF